MMLNHRGKAKNNCKKYVPTYDQVPHTLHNSYDILNNEIKKE